MSRTVFAIGLGMALLVVSPGSRAEDIALPAGGTLSLTATRYNRSLPHAFHDQALASLPEVYPEHQLLVARRSGTIGDVTYALVGFRETRTAPRVRLQGIAVRGEQAWRFETRAPVAYEDTLRQALEQIAGLPRDPAAPSARGNP